MFNNYSVLMTVYKKENPDYLRTSIDSILNQTVSTNNLVIVCDGPLTNDLDQTLDEYYLMNSKIMTIIHLPENKGVGMAANEGLKFCTNELVARMDSDDISLSSRCEKQLNYFLEHPEIGVLGGHIIEFKNNINHEISRRIVPVTYESILKYAKRRDPFNNQTVMFKKSVVEELGGYRNLNRCEDYDLFVRILMNGYKCANLDEVLVYYRLTPGAFKRRGTFQNFYSFFYVHWNIYRNHYCSLFDLILPCCGQILLMLLPVRLKEFLYTNVLRKN